MYVCVTGYTHRYYVHACACRGQKRVAELQAVVNHSMWILGAESGSLERAVSAPNPSRLSSPSTLSKMSLLDKDL